MINIQKIATDQKGDYKTGFLLDYFYFEKYYQMIAIGLSIQQELDLIQKQYNKLILVATW